MSSRRSRSSRQSGGGGGGASSLRMVTDAQINELVSKLQQLLPELLQTPRRPSSSSDRKSGSRVLQETCNYIRSLQREVDDLSERLSELLETTHDTTQASLIRTLLMQL